MIYGDWIGRWGRAFPEKEALVDAITGRRFTYHQLARDINRLAHFLREKLGISKGDRVACLSLNRAEYITLFFASSRIGAILTPLNFRLAPMEFIYYLEDASPAALFFDRDHQEVLQDLRTRVKLPQMVCFDVNSRLGILLPEVWPTLPDNSLPEIEIGPEDPQLIIYTSGTTGVPKGVILTHGMITWNAMNTIVGWDLRSEDRTILHSAMFYTAGWNVFTLPLFHCRGVNILVQSFDADLILDLIEKEGVTLFFGVPTMYQMLMESPRFDRTDFSKIRFVVSGGAALSQELFQAFKIKKSVHIWEGYGLTEVGPNNFLANGKLGTLGHSMPHVDMRTHREPGSGRPFQGRRRVAPQGAPHVRRILEQTRGHGRGHKGGLVLYRRPGPGGSGRSLRHCGSQERHDHLRGGQYPSRGERAGH